MSPNTTPSAPNANARSGGEPRESETVACMSTSVPQKRARSVMRPRREGCDVLCPETCGSGKCETRPGTTVRVERSEASRSRSTGDCRIERHFDFAPSALRSVRTVDRRGVLNLDLCAQLDQPVARNTEERGGRQRVAGEEREQFVAP